MLVNETENLGEAKRDLGETSFPKLEWNSIFIEVMVMVIVLFIVSFHYRPCEDKINDFKFYNSDFKLYFDISSVLELEMN